jgi:hypothetical protein
MKPTLPDFQELFDAKGQCLGAILGPEAWEGVRELVLARYAPSAKEPDAFIEPLQDWNDLVQFWDFKYPVDLDVACPLCGNETADWQGDAPRRFQLTAANLGGLVTFRCLSCQARIMKRHFKDTIKVEAKPFQPEKSARNLGRPE